MNNKSRIAINYEESDTSCFVDYELGKLGLDIII